MKLLLEKRAHYAALKVIEVLIKPIHPLDLVRKVRNMLDSRTSQAGMA